LPAVPVPQADEFDARTNQRGAALGVPARYVRVVDIRDAPAAARVLRVRVRVSYVRLADTPAAAARKPAEREPKARCLKMGP